MESSSKSIEVAFDIGESIIIVVLNVKGRVREISISGQGIQYRVSWWDGGERRDSWLYPDEIIGVPNVV